MGGTYVRDGEEEKCIRDYGEETYRREFVRRTYAQMEDNMELVLKEEVWKGADWIDLAQDRDK